MIVMYSFTLCLAFVCGIPNMMLTEGVAESHVVEKLWCYLLNNTIVLFNNLLKIQSLPQYPNQY